MLELSQKLTNQAVMSLRTGGQVATVVAPIINPNNLKIEGFYCDDKFSKGTLILLAQDIREIMPQGFAINDHDVLSDEQDLIRLKKILDINFQVIGKPVVSDEKKKLGKVADYAVESDSMIIKKLYVTQSLLKSFITDQLSIDRNQVIEVTNKKIIVRDPLQGVRATAPATS